jgi:threonine aldolase
MPSGTMAQQIALRIYAQRSGSRNIALHPQSHLVVSENSAMQMLHGLQPLPIGERESLYTLADLQGVTDPLAAVLLELPERNIGGMLRPWNEVASICAWARERGIAMHLDGARLWECQPFYGMDFRAMAAPFDSVYVSFYKILNAVAGAALAGPKAFVDEARAWQWRHGGRLVQQYPAIVSAREGLERYLPRVPLYCARACEIAAILETFEDVYVTPSPPHTNMMHVYVRGERERLQDAAAAIARDLEIRMLPVWNQTEIPGFSMSEVTCAEGALELADAEVRDSFARLLTQARA